MREKLKYLSGWIFLLFILGYFTEQVMGTENDTLAYLRRELVNEERHDPPFFRLITKEGGREIYVLGSIHNAHPELLLSARNVEFIQYLRDRGAILFIEHHTPYDEFNEEFRNVLPQTLPQWDMNELGLEPEEMGSWNNLSVRHFDPPLPQISLHSITQIDQIKGLLLFYEYFLNKEMEVTLGFETTLVDQWGGRQNTRELENPLFGAGLFRHHREAAWEFFREGLRTARVLSSFIYRIPSLRNQVILGRYRAEIADYKFWPWENGEQAQDEATLLRNERWCDTLKNYLERTRQGRLQPVLIVCGAAHLKGKNNFLALLLATRLFSKGERVATDNRFVPYSPPQILS